MRTRSDPKVDVPTAQGGASSVARAREDHVVERVNAALEQEIIFGILPPRHRLVEDEIMARFDVTRHGVRKVLNLLIRRGLAIHQPNRGALVRAYSPSEVEELYGMRDLLQSAAIRAMPLPIQEGVADELRKVHLKHLEAGGASDYPAIFTLNNQFHGVFFAACGNATLAEAIETYAWRTHPIRSQGFADQSYLAEAQADHAAIIEAACAGDRDRLDALNRQHILRPMELYNRSMIARLAVAPQANTTQLGSTTNGGNAVSRPSLVSIGCGAGFSGDRVDAPVAVVDHLARLDRPSALMFETLGERTLALAQQARLADPINGGYEPLLVPLLEPVLGRCLDAGIRIVGNFGAANPLGRGAAPEAPRARDRSARDPGSPS
jgi:DNA-binding GntR family transcriptional regulator